jgi:hypothetical protein
MKKTIHAEKAVPWIHNNSGRGVLACNRLASTVRLKPHTTSPAIASAMQKFWLKNVLSCFVVLTSFSTGNDRC